MNGAPAKRAVRILKWKNQRKEMKKTNTRIAHRHIVLFQSPASIERVDDAVSKESTNLSPTKWPRLPLKECYNKQENDREKILNSRLNPNTKEFVPMHHHAPSGMHRQEVGNE